MLKFIFYNMKNKKCLQSIANIKLAFDNIVNLSNLIMIQIDKFYQSTNNAL